MRVLVSFGLLAGLMLPALARADNTADEADVAFRLGNQAYARRDYQQALAAYFLSNRLVPNKNVLFNIARCFEAVKSFDEAYRYYHDLSKADLDADDVREVKAALARLMPRVALVAVTTEPPGAEIFIDREDLGSRGRSPQTLAVAPGRHTVKVKLEGRYAAEVPVAASRGHQEQAQLSLAAVLGTLEVVGTPSGAVIRESADGRQLGTVPGTLELPPGQRLLLVAAPGFVPTQVLATIKAGDRSTVRVELVPLPMPTGTLTVTANREQALVRVDGRDQGFTPTVLALPIGEHTVEVSARDLRPFSQVVRVEVDSEQRLFAELCLAAPRVGAASKTETDADEAAASITVISRAEILAHGYQSLAEALQSVRGIFVSNDRIYSYVGIRGFSPPGDFNTRVLILYDGHAINDVWAGQGYAGRDQDVDLSEVERIEVVRGPGSALYGTGAFFAVINLVPRDTVADDRHVEGVLAAGGLGGGKVRVTGSLGHGDTSLLVSGAGFLAAGADETDLGERGVVRGLDGERSVGASIRARAGGFTLSGRLNQRRKQIPVAPLGTAVDVAGTSYTDVRGFAELRYDHSWDRATVAARAYYDASRFEGTYAYAPLNPGEDAYRQHDFGGADWGGGELRTRLRLFEGNQLTVGLEGQVQSVDQAAATDGLVRVVNRPRGLFSAFLLDEWKVFSRLSVSAGLRVDKFLDLRVLPISPRLALVAHPYEKGLTKLVVGQAFRAPNIYELYFADDNVSQRAALVLAPETITTFELEHSHDLTDQLRLTVGGYANLIDQLVVITEENLPVPGCGVVANTAQCRVYGNSKGRTLATGAEAELRWQPGRFLRVDAHYSFVKLWNAPAAVVAGAPQHLAALKAVVPLADHFVRLSGQATYASARGIGPAAGENFLVEVGLSGQLDHLRYFAGVQNLFDSRYSLPIATDAGFAVIPQYGRTFWFEVAVND